MLLVIDRENEIEQCQYCGFSESIDFWYDRQFYDRDGNYVLAEGYVQPWWQGPSELRKATMAEF